MKEFEKMWNEFDKNIAAKLQLPTDFVALEVRSIFYAGAIGMRALQNVGATEDMAVWTKRQVAIDAELDAFAEWMKLRLAEMEQKDNEAH